MRILDFKSRSIWGVALLSIATLFTACTESEVAEDTYTYPWDDLTVTTDIELSAQIDGSDKVWAAGDCLYIYGCNDYFEIGDEFDDTQASFTGAMVLAKSTTIYAMYDPTSGSTWNFSKDDDGDVFYPLSQSSSSQTLYGVGTKELSTENTTAEVTLGGVMSAHEFIFANMPDDSYLASAEIAASEYFATTASLNISTGEFTTLTSETETISLEVTVGDSATTAYATVLPQSIDSENQCYVTLTMSDGEQYYYIYVSDEDSYIYVSNQVMTTLVNFDDLIVVENNTDDDEENNGDDNTEEEEEVVVPTAYVTLQDVTDENTADYDTWSVECGSISKTGIPTASEFVQLLEVLKTAVESGRDISLIFSDMTSIVSSLFYDGDAAAYAQYLTDVQFPAVTTCSNASSFRDCVNLRRFSAPLMSNNNKIGNYFFSGCTSLVAVNAPDGEEGVYLPDVITTLGNFVFQNCSSIPSFYGATIETLGNSDFAGCTSLTSFEVATTSSSLTTGTTLFNNVELSKIALVTANGTIDLEANTWTVGDNVYEGFKSINGTVFYEDVEEDDPVVDDPVVDDPVVDDPVVDESVSVTLQNVTVDNTADSDIWNVACGDIATTGSPDADEMANLFSVLAVAVESGRDITLVFTDMLKTTTVFYGNEDVTVLEFPSVTIMGSASTFEGCTNLRSVPAEVCTKFHNKCFYNCANLEYVSGPAVETMGTNLFIGCAALATLEIATTVSSITASNTNTFDSDLSGIDLITGANNGSTVDTTDGVNSWTVNGYTFTGFNSITVK
ncbi:MAG: leucine-rich repeat protein [Rikenellaceae bacterium]